MARMLIYLKKGKPDSGEMWSGTTADAKEMARRKVRSGVADQVMLLDEGKTVFHYPGPKFRI